MFTLFISGWQYFRFQFSFLLFPAFHTYSKSHIYHKMKQNIYPVNGLGAVPSLKGPPGKHWLEAMGSGSGLAASGAGAARATHLQPRRALISSVSFRSDGASLTLQRRHTVGPLYPTPALMAPACLRDAPPTAAGTPSTPLCAGGSPVFLGPGSWSHLHFTDSPARPREGRGTRIPCRADRPAWPLHTPPATTLDSEVCPLGPVIRLSIPRGLSWLALLTNVDNSPLSACSITQPSAGRLMLCCCPRQDHGRAQLRLVVLAPVFSQPRAASASHTSPQACILETL